MPLFGRQASGMDTTYHYIWRYVAAAVAGAGGIALGGFGALWRRRRRG